MATDEDDPLEQFRAGDGALPDYAERAYAQYQAATFYLAQLQETRDPVKAAADTCEQFGHDAPRGLCLRCGLGSDVTNSTERSRDRQRQRLLDRQEFLKSRGG